MTYIHPYDDAEVIAGQGTIAVEILRQHSGALHAIFVPVGGGGLIAGIAAYIKTLRPEIKSSASSQRTPPRSIWRFAAAGARVSIMSAFSPTAWRCDKSARSRSAWHANWWTR